MGNTEMRNQADFAKSTLNSEINLNIHYFPIKCCCFLQIITMNSILNKDI